MGIKSVGFGTKEAQKTMNTEPLETDIADRLTVEVTKIAAGAGMSLSDLMHELEIAETAEDHMRRSREQT